MATEVLTSGRVTWTNIIHPTSNDIKALAGRYPQFHQLNLQDCLTELEIPKIDHHDDYLFLVVQFPMWDSPDGIPQPAEVDIFVARGTLVTSHRGQFAALDGLFKQVQADDRARAERMSQGASPLLYHLLNVLVEGSTPLVQKAQHRLRGIEENLFGANTRQMLFQIADLRRSVIALRHILLPQLEIARALERGSWPFIHEELDLYWGDLSDQLARLCAILDEMAEVMAGLSDTVDTLASHRIDEVVRLLTVVTVLTLPLSLLATIFGMNLLVPYSQHPFAFYGVMVVALALTAGLVWFLTKRGWL